MLKSWEADSALKTQHVVIQMPLNAGTPSAAKYLTHYLFLRSNLLHSDQCHRACRVNIQESSAS